MEDLNFNIWSEKLNIGMAIYDIGLGKKITLKFDKEGHFSVEDKRNIYNPKDQPLPQGQIYMASMTVKSDEGDWAKYAAEELLCQIEKQMQCKGLCLVE